jgi:hypothetical protein
MTISKMSQEKRESTQILILPSQPAAPPRLLGTLMRRPAIPEQNIERFAQLQDTHDPKLSNKMSPAFHNLIPWIFPKTQTWYAFNEKKLRFC